METWLADPMFGLLSRKPAVVRIEIEYPHPHRPTDDLEFSSVQTVEFKLYEGSPLAQLFAAQSAFEGKMRLEAQERLRKAEAELEESERALGNL